MFYGKNYLKGIFSFDFIFEGIPVHDSRSIYIQVGKTKNLVSIRSTQKLFSSCLCLVVSQIGLVSKPKSENFGLASQFLFTKYGMKLNFLS